LLAASGQSVIVEQKNVVGRKAFVLVTVLNPSAGERLYTWRYGEDCVKFFPAKAAKTANPTKA